MNCVQHQSMNYLVGTCDDNWRYSGLGGQRESRDQSQSAPRGVQSGQNSSVQIIDVDSKLRSVTLAIPAVHLSVTLI